MKLQSYFIILIKIDIVLVYTCVVTYLMSYADMMLINMLFSYINKINSGNYILDGIYTMFLIGIFYIVTSDIKNLILKKINTFYSYYDKTNKIIFSSTDKDTSKRFRAVMFFISKNCDETVKSLVEKIDLRYNRQSDTMEETNHTVYRVDQIMNFNIDKNIYGKIYYNNKEKGDFNGKINYEEFINLEVKSKKLSLQQIQDWIDRKLLDYNNYLRSKSCDQQLLLEVGWNPKDKELDITYNPWSSNVTFENRFFNDKDKILSKIDFFINNPKWYKERGIPYTLGFLLWGEPGCGKTGFIKALMNLTKRHGISIKLNKNFNMNKLREIIYDDEINDDIIIPQDNRILIFEDIDCMDNVVSDRDSPDSDDESDDSMKKLKKGKSSEIDDYKEFLANQLENNYNNNLSYFLNILDGLQECNGRIIIMTTNKPETLDKALIRPGRIDHNIHFTKASCNDIKNILNFYWNNKNKEKIKIDMKIDYKLSHAEIVNICRISENMEETIKELQKKLS